MNTESNATEHFGTFFPRRIDFTEPGYDPYGTIAEIFEDHDINYIREDIWRMFKTAIKDENEYDDKQERGNLIFSFELFSDILTAAYLINKERQAQTEKSVEPELITQT